MISTWIKRKRHARGYGVHAPFAFEFITNVLYNKYHHYSFADLEQLRLSRERYLPNKKLSMLSMRLTSFYQPENILEINSGIGVNSIFINQLDPGVLHHCLEHNLVKKRLAEAINKKTGRYIEFIDRIEESSRYDAIFVYAYDSIPDLDLLFTISEARAFWVIEDIDTPEGQPFWKAIVDDPRARLTFDMKNIGVALLRKVFEKQNYLI